MDFRESIQSGFSNYVNFSDRADRSEYWFWVLFVRTASARTDGGALTISPRPAI
jgi:uncharacterized membrane protein YhaH (DUF805 family)